MKAWYDKHSKHLGTDVAIKIIRKEIEKAEKDNGGGLSHLSTAYTMICDLFEVLGVEKPVE